MCHSAGQARTNAHRSSGGRQAGKQALAECFPVPVQPLAMWEGCTSQTVESSHQGSRLTLGRHHDGHCPHAAEGGGREPWGEGGLLAGGLGLRPVCPVLSVPVDWHFGVVAESPVDVWGEVEGQGLAGEAGGGGERPTSRVVVGWLVAHRAASGSGERGSVRRRLGWIQFVVLSGVHGGQGAVFGNDVRTGTFSPGKGLGSHSVFPAERRGGW